MPERNSKKIPMEQRKINLEVFEHILSIRRLRRATIEHRLNMPRDVFKKNLTGSPNKDFIERLSRELVVSPHVLFLNTIPRIEHSIVDFRSNNFIRQELSRETLEIIEETQRIARYLKKNRYDSVLNKVPKFESLVDKADLVRDLLGISHDMQIKARDQFAFYGLCRRAVEQTGVIVMQENFPIRDGSGFCLSVEHVRIILINTSGQSPARRIFTLMHEFGHALLDRSGISDAFKVVTPVERECNSFSAALLLPRNMLLNALAKFPIRNVDDQNIRLLSNRVKTSQQAVILRLCELGLLERSFYTNWMTYLEGRGERPDYLKIGGGPVPQAKVKLAKYGYNLAHVFEESLKNNASSPIEIAKLSGLKPKYFDAYFDLARSGEAVSDQSY